MSNFISITPLTGGVQGTNPSLFSAVTSDALLTVTGSNYLGDIVDQVEAGDSFILRYAADTEAEAVAWFYAEADGDNLNLVQGFIGA